MWEMHKCINITDFAAFLAIGHRSARLPEFVIYIHTFSGNWERFMRNFSIVDVFVSMYSIPYL